MNVWDDKVRVEKVARVEKALMTVACYFAAFRNGNLSHSFDYL